MGTISEVRVRVPGSSANLGPGFDSLGLALGLYDDVEVSVAPDGVVGRGARARAPARCPATTRTWWCGPCAGPGTWSATPRPGIRMRCRNAIPHSRGLGSSAAAAVAGAVAAMALSGPRHGAGAGDVAAGHRGYGGARRQRGGQPARRLRGGLGDRPGISRSGSTLYGSTRTRASTRWRSSRGPNRRPAPPAGCCPTGYRWPTRPSPAAAPRSRCWPSPNAPSCCCRPPRTGCTRSTGVRPTRSRPSWWTRCVRGVSRRPSPAPGRPCSR